MPTKVIIVEDDANLRNQVMAYLALSGIDVVGAGSAGELYRQMAVEKFSIIILDLGLPDEDGLSVATHLRRQGNMGIIMTTARSDVTDRVQGFDVGADIYMPKPVDFAELVAAVRSLSRRVSSKDAAPAAPAVAACSAWRFDPAAMSLTPPDGATVDLTANEVTLMKCFKNGTGAVVDRGVLLQALGYPAHDRDNRSLDAAIRRLRLKVAEQTGEELPIRTVHALGYLFKDPIA